MRKMPFLLGSLLLLTSTAMAETPRAYLYLGKANTPYASFQQDERECTSRARSDFNVHYYDTRWDQNGQTCTQYNASAFLICMGEKGYQQDSKSLQDAKWFRTTWRWRVRDPNKDCERDREKTLLWLAKPFQSR